MAHWNVASWIYAATWHELAPECTALCGVRTVGLRLVLALIVSTGKQRHLEELAVALALCGHWAWDAALALASIGTSTAVALCGQWAWDQSGLSRFFSSPSPLLSVGKQPLVLSHPWFRGPEPFLDAGFWFLDFGSPHLCWVSNPCSYLTLNPFWTLDFGHWILDLGLWVLDVRFWISDLLLKLPFASSGCGRASLTLAFWISDFVSSICV